MSEVNDLFVKASRLKLRIPTPQGSIAVEDLWDLDLTSSRPGRVTLDSLAVELNRLLKDNQSEPASFVNPTTGNPALRLTKIQFDVVKYILDVKVEEAQAAELAHARAETKKRLQEALDNRERTDLSSKTAEELREELNKL